MVSTINIQHCTAHKRCLGAAQEGDYATHIARHAHAIDCCVGFDVILGGHHGKQGCVEIIIQAAGATALTVMPRLAKAGGDERHTINSQRFDGIANRGDAVRDLALAGAGVAAIPRFSVAAEVARGKLVPLMERYRLPTIPVFLYFTRRAQMPKRVRLIADALAESFKVRIA